MRFTEVRASLLIAVVLTACRVAQDPEAVEGPNARRTGLSVRVTIESFLGERPDFGALLGHEEMPDWAGGSRSRVITESGEYIFYLKNGDVHAVYTFAERGGRLWLTGPRFRKDATGAGRR